MTDRERMLAAIRGRPTDQIPWAPRMDLWAIGQRARGTMPAELVGLDLPAISDALGFGCRVVQADYYSEWWRPDDLLLHGFGIENRPDFPFRVEVADLPVSFEVAGGRFRATIGTPAGEVETELELNDDIARQGSYEPWVLRRAIRSATDLEPVAQLFEHLRVVPRPEGFRAFRARIGERGLAVAHAMICASPMHLVQHNLMALDDFIYLYLDDRPALQRLAERMTPFFEAILDVILQSEAEIFLWGANYDQSVTWPDFFRDEIAPWLRAVSDRAHAHGKLVLTHADGENAALLDQYPACRFDVAESVCTRPMVRSSLAELRVGFGRRTTVWGGIPSVALLAEAMDDSTFGAFLDDLFAELGSGERLILGVSDNVPPEARLDRLAMIGERIAAFGPIRPERPETDADELPGKNARH